MTPKEKPVKPAEVPEPSRKPGIVPPVPEMPLPVPEEDPYSIPEEDPFEITPEEVPPPPGEGP